MPKSSFAEVRRVLVSRMEDEGDQENEKEDEREDGKQRAEGRVVETRTRHCGDSFKSEAPVDVGETYQIVVGEMAKAGCFGLRLYKRCLWKKEI